MKRLADDGYVRAANIRGRSSYYTLSEPLYAIWHQMRFGRDARMKMNWLVTFLKGWYDAKELGEESQRLQDLFSKYLSAGLEREARDALEHRRYLMEAIEDKASRVRTFESIILGYLELSDLETLKTDMLPSVDTRVLSDETRQNDLKRSFTLTGSAYRTLVDSFEGRLLRVRFWVFTEEFDSIKSDWPALINYAKAEEDQIVWLDKISEVIRFVARAGHWTLAQELITSGDLEQPLFPMARALEYLNNGDEAVIEKLSPEMKTIVEEIVTTLKKGSTVKPAPAKKASSRKRKSK